MATLVYPSAASRSVFTPITTTLSNLPNGVGTLAVIFKRASSAGDDMCGLLNSAGSTFYDSLIINSTGTFVENDDGRTGPISALSVNATDWYCAIGDWPSTAAAHRFHLKNLTTAGAWSHGDGSPNGGASEAGPGTTGWFRIGDIGDFGTHGQAIALVAGWTGVRMGDTNAGLLNGTSTSEFWNSAAGHPDLLIQCNATTLVDIGANPSTYSSANSTGATLTGGDPPGYTFDGVGGPNPESSGPWRTYPERFGPF